MMSLKRGRSLSQKAAAHYARLRRRTTLRNVTVVGVTGSTGKTTAKDLAAEILARAGAVTKSRETGNTPSWVIETLLRTRSHDRFCVIEMSAAFPGALTESLALARPQIGIVTTIGVDHLKAFRTREATAAEKGRLIAALPETGLAVLNADDQHVLAMQTRARCRVMTFGMAEGAIVQGRDVSSVWPERLSCTISYQGRSVRMQTQLCGEHWIPSVLAAVAVGVGTGASLDDAADAVAAVPPWNGRMNPVVTPDGVTFIRDDWKAPLATIPPALEFMRSAKATRKVVVVGTISDYTGDARAKYVSVARHAREVADHVVFVGPWSSRALRAKKSADDDSICAMPTVKDAAAYLGEFLRPGDLVLLKGSNPADHLGRIVLARTGTVGCWRTKCGRQMFCEPCSLLRIPAGSDTVTSEDS